METWLYALTFFPMLITALVTHEAGHFLCAKALGVRATGFQVGIGPRIGTRFTGGRAYHLQAGLETPANGQAISAWTTTEGDDEEETIIHWLPHQRTTAWTEQEKERAITWNTELPACSGVVKATSNGRVMLADTAWTLAWIPIMAMVYLPEDPTQKGAGYINTARWWKQMTIIGAGVGANIALLTVTIFILAAAPISKPGQEVLLVGAVQMGSPAEEAGLMSGDAIMIADDTVWPTSTELKQAIEKAGEKKEPLKLSLKRGNQVHEAEMNPSLHTDTIGITLTRGVIVNNDGDDIAERFWNLSETYFSSLAALMQASKEESEERKLTGLVAAAHYTGKAVETAKLKAWIAMLGIITMSMALLNLLPVPPLDGFQLVLKSIAACRKGKQLNPRVEQALGLSGLSLMASAAVYLALQDIAELAG